MQRRTEWTNERPCRVVDPVHADPDGAYTGGPERPGERPVQNADDL